MQEIFEKILEQLEEERKDSYDDFENYAREHGLDEDYDGFFSKGIERAMAVIRAAAHETGWIPCSVRMPSSPDENPDFDNKPLDIYLVSEKGSDYPFRAFWNGECFTDGFSKVMDVTAWQPLPGPYREDVKE